MSYYQETRTLPYSAKQMLDLVLDIEKYPEFLPWCEKAKITNRFSNQHLNAYLVIAFKGLGQKYTSDVKWEQLENGSYEVKVKAIDGPFKKLLNQWQFIDRSTSDKPSSQIKFTIEFEFKSLIFQKMLALVMENSAKKMIEAFEKRAHQLFDK